MVEVAHTILEQRGDVMDSSDLANQVRDYLGKLDSEIHDSLIQLYTDLNIDGNFISLGDNRWGLRPWYAIDSIDEEVGHGMDEGGEDTPRHRRCKKVNTLINNDEDAVDYNNDDPENIGLTEEGGDDLLDDDDDEDEEIAAYDSDLQRIGADDLTGDKENLPGNVEKDLSIIDEDDDGEGYEGEEFSDPEKE